MKKVYWILGLALVIVSACMVYLLINGVVLRSAPLIKPSVLQGDFKNVARDVILRLYPDLLNSHYVLLGLDPRTTESEVFLNQLKIEAEKVFQFKVNRLEAADAFTREQIAGCSKPCWLLLPRDQANELRENSFISEKIVSLGRPYISISWIDFHRGEVVSEACDQEKRLDLQCLGPIGLREVARKLKETSKRYYFLRKYNERDHFLFVEQKQ
jgi:hypothetical protein